MFFLIELNFFLIENVFFDWTDFYFYWIIKTQMYLHRGGAQSQYSLDRRPTGWGGGGDFLFHGTEIRGYSQKIRGYSPECPGGLTTSMLIHILICDIGGVFWTPPPNSACQNSRPYYFLCTTPPRRRQRRAIPWHFTPLSYFTASPRVNAAERRFFLFFSFPSAPETTIFRLTRCSATLPMGARGGACVIDAPRRQCFALHIYTKIGYITSLEI